ncbi:MAG: putative rane spanning protein [Micavibrio sp.]|nr:putative rane spanning protein [Micavibrio sp.]
MIIKSKEFFLPVLGYSGLTLCLFFYMNHRIQPDMAWLMIAAKRLAAGGTMSTDFYETNPPLSVLFYIIPALTSEYLSFLPPYLSPLLFSVILYFMSVASVAFLVRQMRLFETGFRRYCVYCYAAALIIIPLLCFGQRDHVVAMALLPFMLVQWSLTQRIVLNSWLKWPVLIIGSIVILLKPPCGLVPVLMLADRFYRQRRFSIVFDPDVLALASALSLYLVAIFIFFPDFISNILPDDLVLYIMIRLQSVAMLTGTLVFLSAGLGLLLWSMPADSTEPWAGVFILTALLCLVSYYVQGKGFYYHLVPFLIFSSMAMAFVFYQFAASFYGRGDWKTELFSFIAFVVCLFGLTRPPLTLLTHADFQNSVLVKTIQNKCGPDCSFFMFNDALEIFAPVSLYAKREFGSRFSVYWFLPGILQEQNSLTKNPDDKELSANLKKHREKYTQIVAEDFKRYKPQLILIGDCTIYNTADHHCIVSFAEFFSTNREFRRQWSHYKREDIIKVPWKRYFDASIKDGPEAENYTFTVYRRKS